MKRMGQILTIYEHGEHKVDSHGLPEDTILTCALTESNWGFPNTSLQYYQSVQRWKLSSEILVYETRHGL